MLLQSGTSPSASAAETYQNFRREMRERLPRPARLPARLGAALSPFPRFAWLDLPFLPALVLRAIGVRSSHQGKRANQAAPWVRAA